MSIDEHIDNSLEGSGLTGLEIEISDNYFNGARPIVAVRLFCDQPDTAAEIAALIKAEIEPKYRDANGRMQGHIGVQHGPNVEVQAYHVIRDALDLLVERGYLTTGARHLTNAYLYEYVARNPHLEDFSMQASGFTPMTLAM